MNRDRSFSLLKSLPFFVLVFLSLGCQFMETVESTKIPQAEIKQFYSVSATKERTSVSAQFNQGSWGKSVDLDAPSKIEHNGREIAQSTISFLSGTYYAASTAGVEKNHTFVYTNNDGKIYRNELSFEPLEIASERVTIDPATETIVKLSRAVGKDEKISITLKSAKAPPGAGNANAAKTPKASEPAYEISLADELDATRAAIVLKPKNLKNFVRGSASLSVEVSREMPLQQQNQAGGSMSWRYTSTIEANVSN